MDDLDFRSREKEEGSAQLLRKLACEVEGHSAEVGVTKEFVQVVRQQLKHQAQVVPIHKVTLHTD